MPVPPEPDRPDAGVPRLPPRSIVVVGAGLAGAQSVAALRALGFDGHLTLLGSEGLAPYDRPPLSKQLLERAEPAWLTGELGVDVLALADDVRLASPATGLAVGAAGVRITTADAEFPADAVILATGSHAIAPPGWTGAVTLHTAADADALRARLHPGARLVVVGAGWIGAEVAGVAAAAGVDVTVVEAADAPLAAALGAAGALTAGWYAAAGVRLLTGSPAAQVRADGVRLADGRWCPADVVLAAIGARPATGWLAGAVPIDPDGAIRVDARYAVVGGPAHVRAVGDLARRRSARHGWVPGGHWDGALRGPAVAAAALLARAPTADATSAVTATVAELAADPAPYVFSTQLGHDLTLYGSRGDADELVLRGDPAGPDGWTALWFAGGTPARDPASGPRELTAVLTVDRPRDAGAARRLYAGAALPRLDPRLAADPSRPLRSAVAD
ncbi:FAD-dependent oxidoreductase [Pengzhenrongella sicca]|uniref:FAD-dependent oxidoreductase n=1 Tax=Pengzhenrongella sicca TaxID=2819238 RepID=UPI001D0C98E1|nr:FAD-dependent oxidoreductase [Pengzhenrongella sicca]